jgi:uncharacterized membrane protein (UPF0127 family)
VGLLRNVTAGVDLSSTVVRATSPLDRVIGWLRVSKLAPQQGMWLQPCSAIHTIGMRTAIDVILLDRESTVVALRPDVRPNRCWWLSHRRAKTTIEMGPGFLAAAQVAVGDRLELVDSDSATR